MAASTQKMKPKHSSDQQEGKRAVTSEGGPTKRLRFEMPETEGNTQVNEGYMDLSLNDLNNIKSLRQSKRKEFALASWEDSGMFCCLTICFVAKSQLFALIRKHDFKKMCRFRFVVTSHS